jgi:hypothetical protein
LCICGASLEQNTQKTTDATSEEGWTMETPKLRTRYGLLLLLVLVPALGWGLGSGSTAIAGYADSAHGDAIDGVERSGCQDSQEPPQACPIGSCAQCHDTFDSDICTGVSGGPHQLFAELDSPDFCMECHTDTGSVQVGGMPDAAGDIVNAFGKTYKHDVTGYSSIHRFWYASPPAETSGDVEDRTYLSANKHVECNDCHNPHLAEAGLHSSNQFHVAAGTNLIADSGPLTGALGVTYTPAYWDYFSSWTQGGASSWPSTSSTATKECEICFKCHTNYNTNFASWGGSGSQGWTNLALEFNPNKQSYHPVVQALPEIDPGYEYDSEYGDEYDRRGSNRLPPAFTSLMIGDSGLSSSASSNAIAIDAAPNNTKWSADEWQYWGVRVGSLTLQGNTSYNNVGRITSNSTISLSVTWAGGGSLSTGAGMSTDTVYSIEYYAGTGTRSGLTVTDSFGANKNFYLYLPSLAGYVVVITDAAGNNICKGTVQSNTASSFTVDAWTQLYGSSVPGTTGTIGYYFSATGQTMMCSDCHSSDEISTTAAQGPHGSAVKWMLKGRNRAWPTLDASDNGLGTGTLRKIGNTADPNHRSVMDGNDNGDGLFCLNCHSTVSFSKDKYGRQNNGNVHTIHGYPQAPECARCHIMVPHGGAISRLIGGDAANGGAMPVRYAFNNTLSENWMNWFIMKTFGGNYDGTAGDPAGYGPNGGDYCYVKCGHHPSE